MTSPAPAPTRPRRPAEKPPPSPSVVTGAVQVGEVLLLREVARRFGWRRHSVRQARRLGLPIVRFGSKDYVRGADLFEWLGQLASKLNGHQAGDGADGRGDGGR